MPIARDEKRHYRCRGCLHKHYFTPGVVATLKDGKRVVDKESNFGTWAFCEDPECTCMGLYRMSLDQLESLVDKAEELLNRPIGHRPPGVEVPA